MIFWGCQSSGSTCFFRRVPDRSLCMQTAPSPVFDFAQRAEPLLLPGSRLATFRAVPSALPSHRMPHTVTWPPATILWLVGARVCSSFCPASCATRYIDAHGTGPRERCPRGAGTSSHLWVPTSLGTQPPRCLPPWVPTLGGLAPREVGT